MQAGIPGATFAPAVDSLFGQLQTALAGRFSLERELGRGGMGVVYLARDVALERLVAIKLLPAELAEQPEAKERFLREARTAAGLSHPNIVPIHLVEEKAGLVYFVMAFVEGETLGERVRRHGPLPPAEVTRIIREVAWALGYAHGRGVVHRDVKPDNILLEKGSGRAMVTDFGIARVAARSTMSQQGEILGTIQYMAPEQASPAAVLDGRTDLYALGATAFFALTGRLPFEAPTAVALLAMHLTEPAPPVTSVRAGVPPKLAEAVDRCLAKDVAARFASAEALAESLGEITVAKPVPPAVIAVRDAANMGFYPVLILGVSWLASLEIFPEYAAALGFLTAALAALGFAQLLGAVRQALRDGLSHGEVMDGLLALSPVSPGNVELTRQQLGMFDRAVRHPVGRLVAAAAGGFYIWFGGSALVKILTGRVPKFIGVFVPALGSIMFIGLGVVLLLIAVGRVRSVVLLRPEKMETRRGRFIRLIWSNPVTRFFFRLASLGLGRPKAAVAAGAAPTEVVLGKAADELFDALPKEQRSQLRDLPDVIKALEGAAHALRGRRDELGRAIAEVGQAGGERREAVVRELGAVRDEAAARLGTAVTALENLRLDLLRLRAGVGGLGELTAALEAARSLSADISHLIAGREEAERVLKEV
ncbi:MAG: protein kinase [Gemmatimonadales bacterium]